MAVRSLRAPRPRHARILGLGAYRPSRVVTNAELCGRVDSTDEWIVERCGIRERRFAADDETLLTMAVEAAGKACGQAGIEPDRIGCVVVASMSNLVQTPPLAIAVAHELGARTAGGFDLSAACAGFCHALGVVNDMVSTGAEDYVLVIGVERMTDIVDPADRNVAILFADGAGAMLIGPADEPGISPAVRGADGRAGDALAMTTSWGAFRRDPGLTRPNLTMDGQRVFRWAITEMVPASRRVLAAAGVDVHDLAAFVPHQANLRMIDLMAKKLGLADGVAIARDVVTAGNTSAASIPLALDQLVSSGAVAAGGLALLVGFGAGLNYAGQVVRVP
ncbi:beta-ketoacyl-ACP synthase III [Actinokineospora sp.]|uniref:beta-ketoacyl-ACP synthase III n=1 Tax=Actinokineospora sp. TaxID=1872133 RepID=UPI004038011A